MEIPIYTVQKAYFSPYDTNNLIKITLNGQGYSFSRRFFEKWLANMAYMPHPPILTFA
jgi:hypothetical protein